MKLELLVVVAVAVLLPSFSESRIVSKCELREKLGEMLDLPRRLKERTLATGELKYEDETSSEDDDESKNLYGLFQLSDREFCDSGLCPSKSMCHASCTAFTDNDITDDIACVVKTGYWNAVLVLCFADPFVSSPLF
uniref:Glycosyl hydrolases family 22 (GH22) domain-containing protein n=1 Tax=Maylandia zebra TaxID=106582 RepID=A0A3P9BKG7_9CICH